MSDNNKVICLFCDKEAHDTITWGNITHGFCSWHIGSMVALLHLTEEHKPIIASINAVNRDPEHENVKTWDISGFGGGYEEGCQKMLWTGIKYLAKYDQPSDLLKGTAQFKNVYGLIDTPESFKECRELMLKVNEGCSGAQYHAVVQHLMFIAKNGLAKWHEELTKARPNEQPLEFDLTTMTMVKQEITL